ncbi:DUF3427 domain-containing protein [Bifidobacterium phasiani]
MTDPAFRKRSDPANMDGTSDPATDRSYDGTASVLEDVMSGLIERSADAPGIYAPRLIANHDGSTMGDVIGEELDNSDGFDMSVAFVSAGAVRSLFEDFKTNAERNDGARRSRLITSTKNHFNTPAAFWDLLRLKRVAGVDVRIWNGGTGGAGSSPAPHTGAQGQPFHPKGYMFARHLSDGRPYYNLYVGSSNLTQTALGAQREWNLKVSSLEGGELVDQIRTELDSQIAESEPLTEEWITRYEQEFERYERELRHHAPSRRDMLDARDRRPIEPNAMQCEALDSLSRLRAEGEHRAIVISATGTGKTYLSAFDVRQCRPRRMLYVAEREQILTKAMASYRTVLGCPESELGLLSGTRKDLGCRYVFAMAQTLSKPDILERFAVDEFDYILIDEAHHVGADRYQRILNHFTDPGFLLGMTATPERTDGYNIYSCFGHNIAYEIRLQRALDEDMLCPFHYYGVAEYLGEDGTRLAPEGGDGQLRYEIGQLASPERVRYIIDMIQTYTPYHQQVTGLVFCSRVDEAERLSALFNTQINQQAERAYRTIALSGGASAQEREDAVRRLEEGELDYIFTVDLFNEGIDIPSLNQIVMLRSTQSSIVFTQQLGRGLRKCDGKDSVIVIDFIGNYANNYLIPVALYGNTGDRDVARRNLQRRSVGLSSISFDRIARERVLRALDQADWSEMKKLTEHYRQLRYELARIPMLTDVYARDPSLPSTMASKNHDYLSFVRSRERSLSRSRDRGDGMSFLDQLEPVSTTESAILKMATELLLPGLRPHELVILDELCGFGKERISDVMDDVWRPVGPLPVATLQEAIARRFPDAYLAREQLQSALRVLDYSYFLDRTRSGYGGTPLIAVDGGDQRRVRLSAEFAAMLAGNRTFRIFFADTIRCGLLACRDMVDRARASGRGFDRGFLYEQKYKMTDVMRLLGWDREMNGQNVGGYFRHRETGTMPIFVKYANSQYDDRFLGLQELRYFSKNNRTADSPEFLWMRDGYGTPRWQDDHFIPLFVMRKEEKSEARYYYVGHVTAFSDLHTTDRTTGDGKRTKIAVANLRLARPLDPELFRHLTGMTTS